MAKIYEYLMNTNLLHSTVCTVVQFNLYFNNEKSFVDCKYDNVTACNRKEERNQACLYMYSERERVGCKYA